MIGSSDQGEYTQHFGLTCWQSVGQCGCTNHIQHKHTTEEAKAKRHLLQQSRPLVTTNASFRKFDLLLLCHGTSMPASLPLPRQIAIGLLHRHSDDSIERILPVLGLCCFSSLAPLGVGYKSRPLGGEHSSTVNHSRRLTPPTDLAHPHYSSNPCTRYHQRWRHQWRCRILHHQPSPTSSPGRVTLLLNQDSTVMTCPES